MIAKLNVFQVALKDFLKVAQSKTLNTKGSMALRHEARIASLVTQILHETFQLVLKWKSELYLNIPEQCCYA